MKIRQLGVLASYRSCFCRCGVLSGASPVDFGRAELARALQERGLSPVQMTVSIRAGTPESWSLTPKA
jgi:hypothetical protein